MSWLDDGKILEEAQLLPLPFLIKSDGNEIKRFPVTKEVPSNGKN